MLVCVVVVALRLLGAVGADPGSLAGAYRTYYSIVADTSPPPTEVVGQSLCSCQYQCYVDAKCKTFSFTKGQTVAENTCYVPSPDAKIIGYKRKAGYISFLKDSLSKHTFTLGSTMYHFIPNPTPFADAAFFCPSGARLACPSNPDQYELLRQYIQGNDVMKNADYWVDLSHPGSDWVWGDGTVQSSSPGDYPWEFPHPTVNNPGYNGVMGMGYKHKLLPYPKDAQPSILCQQPA